MTQPKTIPSVEELGLLAATEIESLRDECQRKALPDGTYFHPGQGHKGKYDYNAGEHRPPHMVEFTHSECRGRGWTPTFDYDRITAAVRERGWSLNIYSRPDWVGDEVRIYREGDYRCVAAVEEREGLRDTHALLLALCRALGVV